MSANGHENNGFTSSPEDQSQPTSLLVSNIRRYSALTDNFEVIDLLPKPNPPLEETLPDYILPAECIIDPNRPTIEYKPQTLEDIYASKPFVATIEQKPEVIDMTEVPENSIAVTRPQKSIVRRSRTKPGPVLSPEDIETPESHSSNKLKWFQKIGILAVAASTKINTLELGKKAREYKKSWTDTANEVSMDIALKSLTASAAMVDIGNRAKLTLENTMKRSAGSEKSSDSMKVLKYALGAVALVGVTYATYKFGANPFGGNANLAEKTNHTADLFAVAKPTKAPQAEHIQAAHAVLGAPAVQPEHVSHTVQVASALPHKPNINTNDLPWNVAHKAAPNHEVEQINRAMADYSKAIKQPVRWDLGSNGIIKVGNHTMTTREELQFNKILIGLK